MPRYYCDTYLTHNSPSVRKQHNAGYKHKANVREYYQQFEQEQTQSLIDQRIKEHLGNSAAYGGQPYGQIGAAYNQHLMGQPRLPGMPQMLPGFRPPVLPRPPVLSAPVFSHEASSRFESSTSSSWQHSSKCFKWPLSYGCNSNVSTQSNSTNKWRL